MLPSTAATVRILIKDDLGQLAEPTDDPTALLLRNGSDSGVTVTLTEVSEGIYSASWTNGAWSHGDELQLQVTSEFGLNTFVEMKWEGSINVASSGGLDASGVRSAIGLASANLDTQLSGINAKTTNLPSSPAATGAAMTLTSGERSTLAAAIETAMLNEGDATALLQAIADKIAAENPDFGDLSTAAIASAVWANATRTLTANPGLDAGAIRTAIGLATANLDTKIAEILAAFGDIECDGGLDAEALRAAIGLASANLDTQLSGINSKTTNLPSSPAATGAAMALTTDERSTLAGVIDSRLLDDGDATDLIAGIVARLGTVDIDETSLVAAIKASLIHADDIANKIRVDSAGAVRATETSVYETLETFYSDNELYKNQIATAVWANATRTLSANPGLDAVGIRTALGLTTANLDTQLAGIPLAVDTRLSETHGDGSWDSGLVDLSEDALEAISEIITDTIGGIRSQVFGLIIAGGDQITITQGNDYLSRSGNSILLEIEREGVDFTSATAEFAFGRTEGDPVETVTATVEDAAVGSCSVRVQLRKTNTSHPSGQYRYDCRIFIPESEHDDEVLTVIDGDFVVRPAAGEVTLA